MNKKLTQRLFFVTALFFGSIAFATTFDPAERTQKGHYEITGNWSELKRGTNTLVLKITDSNTHEAVAGAAVTVDYDMVEMPTNPPNNAINETAPGTYEKVVFLGMRGQWKFHTLVDKSSLQDEHDQITAVK